MATAQVDSVIRHLRRAVLRQDAAGRTDGQLLGCFIDNKDEAAFEAIVRRHGPMVFGVCRRLLRNRHDAEDAFQATLLVLARKAPSVRPRERVANWLHGVALRTAMKARTMRAKRRGRERPVTEMPEPEAAQQDPWCDVLPLLDQGLAGLPEKYRLVILLCDLEGATINEAARQLGWPQGTVAGRLARGRKLLARRLASRGVVLSAGSLAVVVSQNGAPAGVPSSLIGSMVKAASVIAAGQATVAGLVPPGVAALMEGVMKTMFMTKLKSVLAVTMTMAVVVGIGAGLLGHGAAAGHQSEGKNPDALASSPVPAKRIKEAGKEKPDEGDLAKLQGTWSLVLHHWKGHDPERGPMTLTVKGDACTSVWEDGTEKHTWRIKPGAAKQPKQIDFLAGGDKVPGIYKLEGDTLLICMPEGKDRPSEFAAPANGDDELFVFRRLRPADGANEKPVRVGHIILEGNTRTEQWVILKALPLSPGDVLDYDVLRTAEKNLAAFRATITVEESIWSADYKDVRLRVMEK